MNHPPKLLTFTGAVKDLIKQYCEYMHQGGRAADGWLEIKIRDALLIAYNEGFSDGQQMDIPNNDH